MLLALALCVPASAQVVETMGARAPVAAGAVGAAAGGAAVIPSVPPASVLAPSLGLAASLGAPAARIHFAPPVAAPQAAAVESSPVAGQPSHQTPGRTSARKDSVPPSVLGAGRAVPSAASVLSQENGAVDARGESSALNGDAAAAAIPSPIAGAIQDIPVERAAAMGRRVWDQTSRHGDLSQRVGVPVAPPGDSGSMIVRPSESAQLRDAVASPAAVPMGAFLARPGMQAAMPPARPGRTSGARPAEAPAAATPSTSLYRLSIEFASGLVVKVRAALGLAPSRVLAPGTRPSHPQAPGVAEHPESDAPVTSTEWLERRGLLEMLSASESVAGDVSAVPVTSARSAAASADLASAQPTALPERLLDSVASIPRAPVAPAPALPSLYWLAALIPAAGALLRKFL